MKSLRHMLIWVGVAGLAFAGCERHEFEDTKKLHMEHGEHGGDGHHDGDHHEADHKKDDHAEHKKADHKKGAHEEKKAETPAKAKAEPKKDAPRSTGL